MGDREGETFVSVPDQRERIAAACKREGYTLLDTFEETDVSGGAELVLRPKLARTIAMIEAGEADIILVAFFDRLVRSSLSSRNFSRESKQPAELFWPSTWAKSVPTRRRAG
jgi:DNA invertase Pin-like site-specific DNA recombinase